jgi:hypothetical protein
MSRRNCRQPDATTKKQKALEAWWRDIESISHADLQIGYRVWTDAEVLRDSARGRAKAKTPKRKSALRKNPARR